MRVSRLSQLGLTAAAALWVASIVVAPSIVVAAAQFVCHQRPDRSFFFHGRQLAVCARCTGLYVGAAVAAPFATGFASQLASRRSRLVLAACALPTLLTWMLEYAALVPFSNTSRFVAALPLGFAAAWLVIGVVSEPPPARLGYARR